MLIDKGRERRGEFFVLGEIRNEPPRKWTAGRGRKKWKEKKDGAERRKEGRKRERERRRGYYVNWRHLTGLFLVLPTAAVGGV